MSKSLADKFGRRIRYLRVSVTDRCNFHCKYCMPEGEFEHLSHSCILSFEDMLFACSVFAEMGVEKIRVTGGEPLVRKGVTDFMHMLTDVKGIEEVTLTTNGSLLEKFADEIVAAGIRRVNISLDSLRPERYRDITGGFDLDRLLKSLYIAKKAGLDPIKTNTVVIRGFNADEIHDFCDFSVRSGVVARFIEFMPIGNSPDWKQENIVLGSEMLKIIGEKYDYEEIKKEHHAGPAKNYRLSNGGRVGIITPISNHFCSECDKLRLTADGKLRPCLLTEEEYDLKEPIRKRDREGLIEAISGALCKKEKEHHVVADKRNERYKRTMSGIGG
ncbi:GTP 3',8-cyclase MoaA [Limisalsivibrio acetivorans]|uniref:GTP 3',8-cyclase MoaA n=1 Tax=Limisalsivibrio acetivorans TaxID=1304888 RepID=UPI0003B60362|nr:GTP 3',8-cyclase MoaA [Limisalsivibrio acetivorans]